MARTVLPRRLALGDDSARPPGPEVWYLEMAALTVLLAVWLASLGPVPAVLAVVVAKHVLVALLVMRIGLKRPGSELCARDKGFPHGRTEAEGT